MSLQTSPVWFKGILIFVLVSIWTGREVSREQLLGYHRVSAYALQLDRLTRYKAMPKFHIVYFGLQR